MQILLIGGSGFVGRAVQEALRAQGHTVRVLSRHPSARKKLASRLSWQLLSFTKAQTKTRLAS